MKQKRNQRRERSERPTQSVNAERQRIISTLISTLDAILVSIISRTSFRKSSRQVWSFNKMLCFACRRLLSLLFMTYAFCWSLSLFAAVYVNQAIKLQFHAFSSSSPYQIKQLWGQEVTVNGHHGTWEHKNIPWLWPENKPLPKKFRGEIHDSHLRELHRTDWSREKVDSKDFATHWSVALTFVLFLDLWVFGKNLSTIPKNWRWRANCQQVE